MTTKTNGESRYERKTMPAWTKDVNGRTVVGITAVMGNVDDGGDRIIQGAFNKTIAENSKRFRHLWQHGADGWDYGVTPPIAAIKRIQEVGREALPLEVQTAYPTATGGLEVEREYLTTPRGDEILACYQAGIALEMSIGFDVVIRKWIDSDAQRVSFGHYRDLIEMKLFDTSDVNWGMNDATVGAKAGLERRLSLLVERMKTLQAENVLAMADELLQKEFFALCKGFGELQAKETSRAEPLIERVSLTPYLDRLRELELALVE
jgi:phage head maturation protease